jgi:low affinity Fe/Cu permease
MRQRQPPGDTAVMQETFRKFAQTTSVTVGSAWAFIVAGTVIVLWALSGWFVGFSNTWQLIINTGTTIVTFLMVFLIQNTQNRDAKSIHLKLDELLRGVKGARTGLVGLEDLSDNQLKELQEEFVRIRDRQPDEDEHLHIETPEGEPAHAPGNGRGPAKPEVPS